MTKDDLPDAVQVERDRCSRLVDAYDGMFDGFEAMLVARIGNIIRNGIVPESFLDQMSSVEETEYVNPLTVEEERQRCIDCINVHYDVDAPSKVRRMLLDLREKFLSGECD